MCVWCTRMSGDSLMAATMRWCSVGFIQLPTISSVTSLSALSRVMADQYANMALHAFSRLLSHALNVLYRGNTMTAIDTRLFNTDRRKGAEGERHILGMTGGTQSGRRIGSSDGSGQEKRQHPEKKKKKRG